MSDLYSYKIVKTIGLGTYGNVKCKVYSVAIHKHTKQKVAIKFLNKKYLKSTNMLERIREEVKLLASLHHTNIIKLFEAIEGKRQFMLVMEYLSKGDLYSYLEKKGKLSESEAKHFISQVLEGLKFCHKNQVAHRDIKLENLLLDEHNGLKIADFGLSNYMPDGEFMRTACGSPNYAAPEILSGIGYCGSDVDVWSAGVVLYALVTACLPFDHESIPVLFAKIKSADFRLPQTLSENLKDLIPRMLDPNPVSRITISQVKFHPWFGEKECLGFREFNSLEEALLTEKLGSKSLNKPVFEEHSESSTAVSSCEFLLGCEYSESIDWDSGVVLSSSLCVLKLFLFKALKTLDLEWKVIGSFLFVVRQKRNHELAFEIRAYLKNKFYQLDFKITKGNSLEVMDLIAELCKQIKKTCK